MKSTGMLIALAAGVAVSACATSGPPAVGRLLYIGTYTGGSTGSQGIYAFRFDEQRGTLTSLGLAVDTPSPSFLTASADGRVVFAVNEIEMYDGSASGSVSSFSVEPDSGRLALLSRQSTRGAHPCHLVLDRTGRYLAVANYTGGNYAVFPVDLNGRLSPATQVVAAEGRGPTDRQQGPHGHAVWFSHENRYLVATDLGVDKLFVYGFDQATGTLAATPPGSLALPPGAGPRHTAFHPDRQRAYVINELNSTITALAWNEQTGTFTAGASVPTRPSGVTGGTTAEIHVHPGGRFVYGSNRGDDSIAVFRIADDGVLTLVEHEWTRGKTPRNFTIDPSGRWLIAANQDSSTVAVFSIDQNTGALDPVGDTITVPTPVSVLVLP